MNTPIGTTDRLLVLAGAVTLAVMLAGVGTAQAQGLGGVTGRRLPVGRRRLARLIGALGRGAS
jgi:hypothetical protein